MVFFNRQLNFFIEQLNWHYKQKHITFIFPKNDLVLMFLRFLLYEGLIYGFFVKDYSIFIYLKYAGNSPIIREIVCFPRSYWTNFRTSKDLSKFRNDVFLQSHLFVVFTLHGFGLLRDLFDNEGGWLLCRVVL